MKKYAHIRTNKTPSYKKEIRINGQRITKRFTRLIDAERWYAERKREKELVECGLTASPLAKDIDLGSFSETWMNKRRQKGMPYSSLLADEQRLKKWILPTFGERTLQKISGLEVEVFLDQLVSEHDLSAATRNRVRALIHKLYSDAVKQGLLETNPMGRTTQWKENSQAFDYWHSSEECRTYLTFAKFESQTFYIFAVLALNTGARIAELIGLQYQDLDIANRRIHICKIKEYATGLICKRTKGGFDRWLGMNQEVYKVLEEHRKTGPRPSPEDFLITGTDGDSASSRTIRGIHQRVCKKAGVKEIRIHDLRHTFASHYVMNGGSLNDLQALLGHSSPVMTQRYAHLAPGYLESKASVVSLGIHTDNVEPLFKSARK